MAPFKRSTTCLSLLLHLHISIILINYIVGVLESNANYHRYKPSFYGQTYITSEICHNEKQATR